jgi:hypothetical protein
MKWPDTKRITDNIAGKANVSLEIFKFQDLV